MYMAVSNDLLYTSVKIDVHVTNGISSDDVQWYGTGFFVRNKDDKVCFVTNRHVLDPETTKEGKYEGLGFKHKKISFKFRVKDSKTNLPGSVVEYDMIEGQLSYAQNPLEDVAVFKDIRLATKDDKNVNVDYSVPYQLLASKEELEKDFCVADLVVFPGYPEWYDKKNFRPIMRTGALASDPRFPYELGEIGGRCFLYEAFSFGGSSGSPVFAMQKGFQSPSILCNFFRRGCFVGINAGHLPVGESGIYKSHSGLSYFFASTVIKELIDL